MKWGRHDLCFKSAADSRALGHASSALQARVPLMLPPVSVSCALDRAPSAFHAHGPLMPSPASVWARWARFWCAGARPPAANFLIFSLPLIGSSPLPNT
ncbi:HNH endonuclease [Sesbania bispinosa]|nr:HNH endonuclease [Sesbania bispinosa]